MKTKSLVRTSLIAGIYFAVAVVWSPFSFGPVQVRISEALVLLPVLCPEAVVGVTVGCLLANLLFSTPLDVVVGTLATLLAALMTRRLRKLRWNKLCIPAALPPVVLNAVLVGGLLTVQGMAPPRPAAAYLFNMATVGAGQLVSCLLLGVLLVYSVEASPTLCALFSDEPAVRRP